MVMVKSSSFTSPTTAVRRVHEHNCKLPIQDTDSLLSDLINSGLCVDGRRKFRKFLLVSETNPESKNYFKSTAQIHDEQRRHLLFHYYMIHPFSNFRILWENVMILDYSLLILIFIPLELYFIYHTPYAIVSVRLFLDLINFVNVGITLFTGYVIEETKRVKLSWRKVVKKYLFGRYYITSMFAVDVLSSLPITLVINVTESYYYFPWKFLFTLKLFRVRTLMKYISSFFIRGKYWSFKLKPLQVALCLLIVVVWCIALSFFVTASSRYKFFQVMTMKEIALQVVDVGTTTVECLILVGPDPQSYETSVRAKIVNIFLIVLGFVLNMIILAQILRIYKNRNAATNKHQKLLQEILEYSTYKSIPSDLCEKMIRYANFKYHRRILREAEIMNTLSEILVQELMLHNCQNLVERVDFFKDLPPHLLLKIVERLRPEIYLEDEVIFHVGAAANCMYFVYTGVVTLYSDTGKSLMICGEGKHFGEVSLMNYTPRAFTAIAKSDCEVLRLSRKDIVEVLKPFPVLVKKLSLLAKEKQRQLDRLVRRSISTLGGSIVN